MSLDKPAKPTSKNNQRNRTGQVKQNPVIAPAWLHVNRLAWLLPYACFSACHWSRTWLAQGVAAFGASHLYAPWKQTDKMMVTTATHSIRVTARSAMRAGGRSIAQP